MQKNNSGCKKVLTVQKSVRILKKMFQNISPTKIFLKVTKFHETWMTY